jgi:hypothetical protein
MTNTVAIITHVVSPLLAAGATVAATTSATAFTVEVAGAGSAKLTFAKIDKQHNTKMLNSDFM